MDAMFRDGPGRGEPNEHFYGKGTAGLSGYRISSAISLYHVQLLAVEAVLSAVVLDLFSGHFLEQRADGEVAHLTSVFQIAPVGDLFSAKAQLLAPGHALDDLRLVGQFADKAILEWPETNDPERLDAVGISHHDLHLVATGIGGWVGGQLEKAVQAGLGLAYRRGYGGILAVRGDDSIAVGFRRLKCRQAQ